MVKRDLDGVYFRVQRAGLWTNVCWTDLTDEERAQIGSNRPREWWERLAGHLTTTIQDIGNQLDLYGAQIDR